MITDHINLISGVNPFENQSGENLIMPATVYGRIYKILQTNFLDGKQLIFLTGAKGTGKTTLLDNFIREFDKDVRYVYLNAEDFSARHRRKSDQGRSASTLDTIKVFILEQSRTTHHNILIIDAAHSLTDRILTSLLSLLKTGSSTGNHICLLLAGESSIVQRVEGFRYFNINDVSYVDCRLDHLTLHDLRLHIRNRLEKIGMGSLSDEIFSEEACEHIIKCSKGNFTQANELCARAFALADVESTSNITLLHVQRAVEEYALHHGKPSSEASNLSAAQVTKPESFSPPTESLPLILQNESGHMSNDSGYVVRMSEHYRDFERPTDSRAAFNSRLDADTGVNASAENKVVQRAGSRALMLSLFASGTIAGVLVIFMVSQLFISIDKSPNPAEVNQAQLSRQQIADQLSAKKGSESAAKVIPEPPASAADGEATSLKSEDGSTLATDDEALIDARHSLAEAEQLRNLFEQARVQAAADKLTVPAGDNAFETYQEILRLNPENARAKSGILDLKLRFTELAVIAVKSGDLSAAENLYKNALYLDPHDKQLASLIERTELGSDVPILARVEDPVNPKADDQNNSQKNSQPKTEEDTEVTDKTIDQLLNIAADTDTGFVTPNVETVIALSPSYANVDANLAEVLPLLDESPQVKDATLLAEEILYGDSQAEIPPDEGNIVITTALLPPAAEFGSGPQEAVAGIAILDQATSATQPIAEIQSLDSQFVAAIPTIDKYEAVSLPTASEVIDSSKFGKINQSELPEIELVTRLNAENLTNADVAADEVQVNRETGLQTSADKFQQSLSELVEVELAKVQLASQEQPVNYLLPSEANNPQPSTYMTDVLASVASNEVAATGLIDGLPASNVPVNLVFRSDDASDLANLTAVEIDSLTVLNNLEAVASFELSLNDFHAGENDSTNNVETDEADQSATPASLNEPSNQEPQQIALLNDDLSAPQKIDTTTVKLNALIELAHTQTRTKKLTSPSGDNSYETYTEVLQLDPANERAIAGIKDIKQIYIGWAETAATRGDQDATRRLYRKALSMDPSNAGLSALLSSDSLETLAGAQQRSKDVDVDDNTSKQKVAALIDKAKSKINEQRFTTPDGDNAYELYTQVLQLDPQNASARSGILDLKNRYIVWGAKAERKGDQAHAIKMYKIASVLDPSDSALTDRVNDLSLSDQDAKPDQTVKVEGSELVALNPDNTKPVPEDDSTSPAITISKITQDAATDTKPDQSPETESLAVSPVDDAGLTPLMTAAIKDHDTAVVALLAAGADIDARDRQGNTALMLALKNNRFGVARQLVFQGSSINVLNQAGDSALSLAAQSGNVDLTKLLVKRGAEINKIIGSGSTALIRAAANNHIDVVKALVKPSTDMNIADGRGWTALMYASKNGNWDMVLHIISYTKVHDNDRNENVRKSIEIAKGAGNQKIASLLQHEMLNFSPP